MARQIIKYVDTIFNEALDKLDVHALKWCLRQVGGINSQQGKFYADKIKQSYEQACQNLINAYNYQSRLPNQIISHNIHQDLMCAILLQEQGYGRPINTSNLPWQPPLKNGIALLRPQSNREQDTLSGFFNQLLGNTHHHNSNNQLQFEPYFINYLFGIRNSQDIYDLLNKFELDHEMFSQNGVLEEPKGKRYSFPAAMILCKANNLRGVWDHIVYHHQQSDLKAFCLDVDSYEGLNLIQSLIRYNYRDIECLNIIDKTIALLEDYHLSLSQLGLDDNNARQVLTQTMSAYVTQSQPAITRLKGADRDGQTSLAEMIRHLIHYQYSSLASVLLQNFESILELSDTERDKVFHYQSHGVFLAEAVISSNTQFINDIPNFSNYVYDAFGLPCLYHQSLATYLQHYQAEVTEQSWAIDELSFMQTLVLYLVMSQREQSNNVTINQLIQRYLQESHSPIKNHFIQNMLLYFNPKSFPVNTKTYHSLVEHLLATDNPSQEAITQALKIACLYWGWLETNDSLAKELIVPLISKLQSTEQISDLLTYILQGRSFQKGNSFPLTAFKLLLQQKRLSDEQINLAYQKSSDPKFIYALYQFGLQSVDQILEQLSDTNIIYLAEKLCQENLDAAHTHLKKCLNTIKDNPVLQTSLLSAVEKKHEYNLDVFWDILARMLEDNLVESEQDRYLHQKTITQALGMAYFDSQRINNGKENIEPIIGKLQSTEQISDLLTYILQDSSRLIDNSFPLAIFELLLQEKRLNDEQINLVYQENLDPGFIYALYQFGLQSVDQILERSKVKYRVILAEKLCQGDPHTVYTHLNKCLNIGKDNSVLPTSGILRRVELEHKDNRAVFWNIVICMLENNLLKEHQYQYLREQYGLRIARDYWQNYTDKGQLTDDYINKLEYLPADGYLVKVLETSILTGHTHLAQKIIAINHDSLKEESEETYRQLIQYCTDKEDDETLLQLVLLPTESRQQKHIELGVQAIIHQYSDLHLIATLLERTNQDCHASNNYPEELMHSALQAIAKAIRQAVVVDGCTGVSQKATTDDSPSLQKILAFITQDFCQQVPKTQRGYLNKIPAIPNNLAEYCKHFVNLHLKDWVDTSINKQNQSMLEFLLSYYQQKCQKIIQNKPDYYLSQSVNYSLIESLSSHIAISLAPLIWRHDQLQQQDIDTSSPQYKTVVDSCCLTIVNDLSQVIGIEANSSATDVRRPSQQLFDLIRSYLDQPVNAPYRLFPDTYSRRCDNAISTIKSKARGHNINTSSLLTAQNLLNDLKAYLRNTAQPHKLPESMQDLTGYYAQASDNASKAGNEIKPEEDKAGASAQEGDHVKLGEATPSAPPFTKDEDPDKQGNNPLSERGGDDGGAPAPTAPILEESDISSGAPHDEEGFEQEASRSVVTATTSGCTHIVASNPYSIAESWTYGNIIEAEGRVEPSVDPTNNATTDESFEGDPNP